MKLLLDTNILIWWLNSHSPLKQVNRDLIDNPDTVVFVSVASLWEISIKQAIGKLDAPPDMLLILESQNISILPIETAHAMAVRNLPLLHGDPFDRMLVAQALTENLTIITHDKHIGAYSVNCFLV